MRWDQTGPKVWRSRWRTAWTMVGLALSFVGVSKVGANEGVLITIDKQIGRSIVNGRLLSIYVTPLEFVLKIAPECSEMRYTSFSRTDKRNSCVGTYTTFDEFSGPNFKPVRVVGYTRGSSKNFRVYIPREYKQLHIRGINRFGNDATIDFAPYDQYVKARSGGPQFEDAQKPTIQLDEPAFTDSFYRTEDLYLTVEGRATDNFGLSKVQLNGETMPVRSGGQFKHRLRLKLGKNPVTLRVTDVNDNVTMRSFMVLRDEIAPETQFSDVDFPAATSARTPQGIAVVIGIEDYRHAPNAPHAVNDAEIFREYLVKRFGYDRRNILLRLDEQATKGEFERIFGVNGWLERQVGPKSQVTVYYSGHGSPDIGSGTAFLVPHDIDPNYPSTGYALSDLYARLDALPAASATLVLDACFSGTSRTNEPLLADARPVALEVEEAPPEQDLVVLSAATGSQISSSADDRLHGLFTYYLLKGIQGDADANQDRVLTAGEVGNYVSAHVPSDARRMGREQTPVLHAADPARVLFRY